MGPPKIRATTRYEIAAWRRLDPSSPEPERIRVVDESTGEVMHLVAKEPPEHYIEGTRVTECLNNHTDCEAKSARHATFSVTTARKGNKKPYLDSVRVEADPGIELGSAFMRGTDWPRLLAAALTWEKHAAQPAEGDGEIIIDLRPAPEPIAHGKMPPLREFARDWMLAENKGEFAEAYGKRRGVSPTTVNRWAAKAREQGLLPPARTGRPPKLRPPTEL